MSVLTSASTPSAVPTSAPSFSEPKRTAAYSAPTYSEPKVNLDRPMRVASTGSSDFLVKKADAPTMTPKDSVELLRKYRESIEQKQPEPIYYIVEKKKKRPKSSYSPPREIHFQ